MLANGDLRRSMITGLCLICNAWDQNYSKEMLRKVKDFYQERRTALPIWSYRWIMTTKVQCEQMEVYDDLYKITGLFQITWDQNYLKEMLKSQEFLSRKRWIMPTKVEDHVSKRQSI